MHVFHTSVVCFRARRGQRSKVKDWVIGYLGECFEISERELEMKADEEIGLDSSVEPEIDYEGGQTNGDAVSSSSSLRWDDFTGEDPSPYQTAWPQSYRCTSLGRTLTLKINKKTN